MTYEERFVRLKPGVKKKYLLLIASLVWFLAGSILFLRAALILRIDLSFLFHLLILLLLGFIFYFLVFSSLSKKHISRIISINVSNPFVLAFFGLKSLVMIPVMIMISVFIRKLNLFPLNYLAQFYIVMGMPLLLSSFKFLRNSINIK